MFSAEDTAATRRLLHRVGLATVLAGAAAAAGLAWAHAAGQALLVKGRDGWTPVPLGAVLTATAIGGAAAYALARVAAGTSRPRVVFGRLVAAGLLASSVPPLATARDDVTGWWLLGLHAVVATVLVPAVITVLPRTRTATTAHTATADHTMADHAAAGSALPAGPRGAGGTGCDA